jgi:hypothetical protein
MKTAAATLGPEESPVLSYLVSIEASAFLADLERQAARDRNADAIADLEVSWKLSK